MNKQFTLSALIVLAAVATSHATFYPSGTLNQLIPDGSPLGMANTITVSDDFYFADGSLDVHLNISGGFNGDLYGYLVHTDSLGDTQLAVLLNRPGLGTGGIITQIYGFQDPGMNVILDTAAGSGIQGINGGGAQVTGTYAPAGAAALDNFNGMSAKGTWTLFLADLSAGGQANLVNWGFDLALTEPVPEPVTWALMIFGLAAGSVKLARWRMQNLAKCRS